MIRKKRSGNLSKTSKKVSLGDLIIQGLKEGVAHNRGEIRLRTTAVHIVEAKDIQELRSELGFSQVQFAAKFGFSLRTLQEWEQGRAVPDRAVCAYLRVIRKNPQAVIEALEAA
jgi:putative transcriptional regulator